jgi:DNA-binding CsgD family transcriptional regulator
MDNVLLKSTKTSVGEVSMTITTNAPSSDFEAIESVVDALLKSENASEFCRALVHGAITGQSVQGCHIYLLDNSSHLSPVAGYGMAYETEKSEISAWDETPLSMAIRQKSFVFEKPTNGEQPLVAVPLLRDSIPVGCLGLVLNDDARELPFAERLIPILSKLGTYCLTTMAFSPAKGSNREANGEDLTSRQIQILDFMAEGLVNAEIAAKLMLSESTIRQETVRIYRALGVPNRSEAAKKGRALGLIKRAAAPAV